MPFVGLCIESIYVLELIVEKGGLGGNHFKSEAYFSYIRITLISKILLCRLCFSSSFAMFLSVCCLLFLSKHIFEIRKYNIHYYWIVLSSDKQALQ